MKILANDCGSQIVDDDELSEYGEWTDTGNGILTSDDGVAELYEDAEIISGDVDGECEVKKSYLSQVGGGKYERVYYVGTFIRRSLVGKWMRD